MEDISFSWKIIFNYIRHFHYITYSCQSWRDELWNSWLVFLWRGINKRTWLQKFTKKKRKEKKRYRCKINSDLQNIYKHVMGLVGLFSQVLSNGKKEALVWFYTSTLIPRGYLAIYLAMSTTWQHCYFANCYLLDTETTFLLEILVGG